MTARRTTAVTAALATALLLSACSGGVDESSDAGNAARGGAPMADTDTAGAPGEGAAHAPAAAAPGGGAGTADRGAPARGRAAAVDRAIAYVGELQVQVDDVPDASAAAITQVRAAGGTLFGQDTSLADDARSTLTFKVPPTQFEPLLATLGELGEPLGRHVSAEDVTEQLVDLDARLRSARASLDRVRALLSRAGTIAEIVALEREVATREAEVESLEARLRSLEGRVEEATLTLHLSADRADLVDEDDRGFMAGLRNGWEAFTASLVVAATVLGAVLPFAVVAALVAGAFVLRRRRARDAMDAAEPV